MSVHRRRRRQMLRRHQAPERNLPSVLAEGIRDARTCHCRLPLRRLQGRSLLRAVLPQGIRSHRQQKETLVAATRVEGRAEGRAEVIQAMLQSGISPELISKALNMTTEQILEYLK